MSIGQRLNKSERRIKTLEDALVWLTALGDSHNEQLEKFLFSLTEMKANQTNPEEKLNALIDAQIGSEERIQNLENKMLDLADYVKLAHQRIAVLEDVK